MWKFAGKKEKAKAADISVLRDRAVSGFGGDTKAVFISFEGFSPECLTQLSGRSDERVILMDGADILLLLSGELSFDLLLAEKIINSARGMKPFVSASEIMVLRQKKVVV